MPTQPTPLDPNQDPAPTLAASLDADLAELTRQGLAVTATTSFFAEVERTFLQLTTQAALAAAQVLAAGPETLEQAIEAGQELDAAEAARTAALPRLEAIVTCHEKAARAVRRAIALRAHLANGRPHRDLPDPNSAPTPRPAAKPRPANDADYPDRFENGDELGTMTVEQAVTAITRDITQATSGLARLQQTPEPAVTTPYLHRRPTPHPAPEPDPPEGDYPGPYRPPPPRRPPAPDT